MNKNKSFIDVCHQDGTNVEINLSYTCSNPSYSGFMPVDSFTTHFIIGIAVATEVLVRIESWYNLKTQK